MASIERTTYPRFGKRMSTEELRDRYELSGAEQGFVGATANGGRQRLTLAAPLKTRQQLGYFPALTAVPAQITEYLSAQLGFAGQIALLDHARLKPTLHRYRNAVRSFLDTKPFRPEDRQQIEEVIRKAAETMSDPADLINVAVAELSKAGIELPAYSTLDRLVGTLRQQVHAELYARATGGLTAEQKGKLDGLLVVPPDGRVTGFTQLKNTPGPAKLKYIREWTAHLQQLERIIDPQPFLTGISRQDDSAVSPDPVSSERSQQPLPCLTPKLVLNISPRLKPYIFTTSPDWTDLVEAAHSLRQQLGISRVAWIEACHAMGRYQAATAVALIAAKGESIRSPGGYLRGMTSRAQKGELHLSNSLWGLARREHLPGTYDA